MPNDDAKPRYAHVAEEAAKRLREIRDLIVPHPELNLLAHFLEVTQARAEADAEEAHPRPTGGRT